MIQSSTSWTVLAAGLPASKPRANSHDGSSCNYVQRAVVSSHSRVERHPYNGIRQGHIVTNFKVMRFTTPLLVTSSLASSVVAADTCGSQWKSYNVLLLPGRSHPPAGFYATTDHAGIWTMGAMDSICVAACDKDELCVGYIGTLVQFSKYDASLRDGGRCHYYKTVNLVALPCRRGNCPNQIWGRTRDNTDKCFTKSAAAASAYCTAQLNSLVPRPVTATVSVTQTPINTVTVTRTLPDITSTICSTPGVAVRRWDEPADVVVKRDSPRVAAVVAGSPPRTWTTKTTSTVSQSTRLPAAAVVRPVAAAAAHANAGRTAANTRVPIPACVMQSSPAAPSS